MNVWKTVRPAPIKPFRKAIEHEANFYRPFVDAARILGRRARYLAEGQAPLQAPQRPSPLRIARQDGWRYSATTAAIVGICAFVAAQGDRAALMLLPIAAVPGILAWAGLRRSKR